MTDFPSDIAINDALDRIFAQPEFRSLIGEALERFSDWLGKILSGLFTGEFSIIPIVIFIVIVLLLILAAVLLIRAASRSRKPRQILNGITRDDPWLACISYAEKGIYDKAMVCLFIWYLQFLAAERYISMEKGKTNFQYELELIRNGYGKLERFRAFKTVFAAVRYGGRRISRDDFESWQTFCMADALHGSRI